MTIGAGALSERITLLRQQVINDQVGGQSRSFVPVATVWAEVLPARPGDIQPVAEAAAGVQGWRIRIRHRSGIDITNRIDWRGRRLAVLAAVDMDGKRKWLTIITDEGVVTA